MGENVPLIHCVCVPVDWLLIAVAGFTINAPDIVLVCVVPQSPLTSQ